MLVSETSQRQYISIPCTEQDDTNPGINIREIVLQGTACFIFSGL